MWRPMRSKIRPTPWKPVGRGSAHRRAKDLVEHLEGELARERVQLAGVEAADETVRTDARLGAMAEPRPRARRGVSERGERPEDPVPSEGAERKEGPELAKRGDLP